MKIKKAKNLDKLYEKTKKYDLVLTVQGPVADALNSRLENSIIGKFAITPKRLVYSKYQNEDLAREHELFLRVIRETDLSWKQAVYLLENIISSWKETGDLRHILKFERFDTTATLKIIEIIEKTPNIFSEMQNFEIDENLSVAVIGPYQFNELDKKVLPEQYDEINVFEDEEKEIPKFRIFGTTTSLLQAVRKNITQENAQNISIVTPSENEYEPLLKSALESDNVPYMSRTTFTESENLRTFLFFLKTILTEERLRLRDVQPVLTKFNIEVSVEHNDEFLKDLNLTELDEFKKKLKQLEKSDFAEALKEFESFTEKQEKIREEFEKLGILEEKINQSNINRLEYYLNSFEIEMKTSNRGVLFASPKTAPYIDRPLIFYVGMDSSWMHKAPEKPWVDNEEYHSRNLKNFQLLLQNGERQYFLVRNDSMGDPISPCLYFDELFDEEFDSFSDFPHEEYWGREEKEGSGFERENQGIEVESEKFISQSELNKFVQSPKQYFFSKLVNEEEKIYLRRGILFHDFAEFYVNHPEFVKSEGIDRFVEIMISEINSIAEDFLLNQLRTEFRIGLENIVEYLDHEGFETIQLEKYGKRGSKNTFSEIFEKDLDSPITEAWFENPELGCKGKVDLIQSENHLLDYKSGRKTSRRRVVTSSNVDLFEDDPNFQAILYLSHHRKIRPDSKLKFTFFHFLDNVENKIAGETEIEDNIVTITYYPKTFEKQLLEEETFDHIIGDVAESNDRRKTLEKMGYKKYRNFFKNHEIPPAYDKEELLGSEFAQEFIAYAKEIVGEYKYVKKGCEKTLRKLVDFRKMNYFREDLDRFEDFLVEQLGRLNEYKKEGFPVGDIDIDELENQDLILGE